MHPDVFSQTTRWQYNATSSLSRCEAVDDFLGSHCEALSSILGCCFERPGSTILRPTKPNCYDSLGEVCIGLHEQGVLSNLRPQCCMLLAMQESPCRNSCRTQTDLICAWRNLKPRLALGPRLQTPHHLGAQPAQLRKSLLPGALNDVDLR